MKTLTLENEIPFTNLNSSLYDNMEHAICSFMRPDLKKSKEYKRLKEKHKDQLEDDESERVPSKWLTRNVFTNNYK